MGLIIKGPPIPRIYHHFPDDIEGEQHKLKFRDVQSESEHSSSELLKCSELFWYVVMEPTLELWTLLSNKTYFVHDLRRTCRTLETCIDTWQIKQVWYMSNHNHNICIWILCSDTTTKLIKAYTEGHGWCEGCGGDLFGSLPILRVWKTQKGLIVPYFVHRFFPSAGALKLFKTIQVLLHFNVFHWQMSKCHLCISNAFRRPKIWWYLLRNPSCSIEICIGAFLRGPLDFIGVIGGSSHDS